MFLPIRPRYGAMQNAKISYPCQEEKKEETEHIMHQ